MKTQQWQLRKAPEPRTLADVPDGVQHICAAGVTSGRLMVMHRKGNRAFYSHSDGREEDDSLLPPHEFQLHTQPSRPTRLEDVPDRRVILGEDGASLWFVECGSWYRKTLGQGNSSFVQMNCRPVGWRLTDCVVEMVETEVGVVG